MHTAHKIAKIFKNGRSQAVRLPKEFRLPGDEVLIQKKGECILLYPKKKTMHDWWNDFLTLPVSVSKDFMKSVSDEKPQERDFFL